MLSVFDPLGPFAPFTMTLRIVLNTIWSKSGQQLDKKNQFQRRRTVRGLGKRDKCSQKIDSLVLPDASLESMC